MTNHAFCVAHKDEVPVYHTGGYRTLQNLLLNHAIKTVSWATALRIIEEDRYADASMLLVNEGAIDWAAMDSE